MCHLQLQLRLEQQKAADQQKQQHVAQVQQVKERPKLSFGLKKPLF